MFIREFCKKKVKCLKWPDYAKQSESILFYDFSIRDVSKTYENAKARTDSLQDKMENILATLGYIFPDIGYSAGMSPIIEELLSVVEDEELAFWLFVGLIEKHKMKFLFMPVVLRLPLIILYRKRIMWGFIVMCSLFC